MKFKDVIWVLFISMVPLIELRGAIPVGTVLKLPYYINYLVAVAGNLIPVPFILLFIPKILDFLERFKLFRPIVQWLHKKADKNRYKIEKDMVQNGSAIESSGANKVDAEGLYTDTAYEQLSEISDGTKGEKLNTDSDILTKAEEKSSGGARVRMSAATFLGLMLFVLLPLPGTGAWTGALVASLFNFPRAKSLLSIAIGVMGCGIIMCLASYGVLGFLSFLL